MKGLLIISGLGILAMLAEIFKFKKLLLPLILLGIVAAYALNFMEWRSGMTFQHIGILSLEFHVDKLSRPLL